MHLKHAINHTILIEKSKFICYMKDVASEEEYRDYLSEIRKLHHDATHVCSALICGNIRRSSDDGEPSGTAGVPMLNVLEKNGMDGVCALVVRYFGGIKLGAGGLIRAYSSSVAETLNEAIKVEDVFYPRYEITLPYDLSSKLERYLRKEALALDCSYDIDVTFTFALDEQKKLETIKELTKGLLPKQIGSQKVEKIVE